MIVKVIIKREVTPGMEHDFFEHLKKLRSHAMQQQGYISGETLLCAENTNKVLIISKWESMADWENWKANSKRSEIDRDISRLQEIPAVYEPYVFSKYKAAAGLEFPLPLQKQKR